MHPGTILTDLSRHMSAEEIRASGAIKIDGEMTFPELTDERKTPQEGAATIVWSAVSSQLDGLGGVYTVKILTSRLYRHQMAANRVLRASCPWAADKEEAKRLWTLSEQLTVVLFL